MGDLYRVKRQFFLLYDIRKQNVLYLHIYPTLRYKWNGLLSIQEVSKKKSKAYFSILRKVKQLRGDLLK